MYIKTEIYRLSDFDAWSGGEETKSKIIEAHLDEEFMEALEEHYPDGLTETQLNDLLWFEDEWCYELVGLNSHGVFPLDGSDVIDNCTTIEDSIDKAIEQYNEEHGTEYTMSELGISEYDFESYLGDWLSENQEDETDHETLARAWLEDVGYIYIEEAIEEAIENETKVQN